MADPALLVISDDVPAACFTAWSEALTISGGERPVVKPLDLVARGRKGIFLPAVKATAWNIYELSMAPTN